MGPFTDRFKEIDLARNQESIKRGFFLPIQLNSQAGLYPPDFE